MERITCPKSGVTAAGGERGKTEALPRRAQTSDCPEYPDGIHAGAGERLVLKGKAQPIDAPRPKPERWISYQATHKRLGAGRKEIRNLVASGVLKTRFEALASGKTSER